VLLVGFFPWSAFLPEAVLAALRQARVRARQNRAGAVTVFAAAWLVAGLVIFSLAETRLPHYVLPLFPAAALLVAAAWPAARPSPLSRILLGGTAVALAALLIAAWVASDQLVRALAPAYPAAPGSALPATALVVAALVAGVGAAALIRDGRRLFNTLAALGALVLVTGFQSALPAFSAQFVAPAGELAARAARAARPCDTVAALGPYRPSLLFYARRPVVFISGSAYRNEARLAELAGRPGRLFVITPATLTSTLPPPVSGLAVVETRGGYVLLASQTAAPGCPA
jgi:4-amino-4-deoxy-L-arabinose transferase-like glycosyltransferase